MTDIQNRKRQHIDITRNQNVEPEASSFDAYKWPYTAMPELDFKKIQTEAKFFDFDLKIPLIISSMTGGEKYGATINRNIAIACQEFGTCFGLGSCRILLENPSAISSFDVKKYCPDVAMFANIGMVQLNYGVGYDEVMKIVDILDADGIFFHLNPLQEALQPGGDTNFVDLFAKFEKLFQKLQIPIVVKEVGHGIDPSIIRKFTEIGVRWIDISGTGGTSWAWIEGYRHGTKGYNPGEIFRSIGIPTAELLQNLSDYPQLNLIAGGGIRNGLHIAKSIALGACIATSARPFLEAALDSSDAVLEVLRRFEYELKVAMFASGVSDIEALRQIQISK